MDTLDRKIINQLQYGFPICDHPYQQAAEQLGTTESELLKRLNKLLDQGLLTRFGPLFNAEKMGGTLSLCAMKIAEKDFSLVTQQVNQFPEVAHNYQRDHKMNMWFVLATKTKPEKQIILQKISEKTGYHVYDMPKEKEYYIGLYLPI